MQSGEVPGFALVLSAFGRPVSKALNPADVAWLLEAGVEDAAPQKLFPPEFKFCTISGTLLLRQKSLPFTSPWIPPFGALPAFQRGNRLARGLRQTVIPMVLGHRSQRRPDGDPDAVLALPPHGNYEFFSIQAETRAPMLLALDPDKGMVYGWLPASQRWEPLEHITGGMLAVSSLHRADWRCEVACEDRRSIFFLPTEEGLACFEPDGMGLNFRVHYLGGAPVIGAPVQFGEQVWVPLRTEDSSLRFISVTQNGELGATVELPTDAQGRFHAPLADGRMALWPGDAGQLVLRKQASGALEARFIAWPKGVHPEFEFGCPFLERDGGLWQLCFDSQRERYVYLQLGVDQPESHAATVPRLSTGSFNFRFAAKYKSPPWHDPEHGDDSGTDEVVLPMLESTTSSAVLGLKLATTVGLADVIKSSERMRVELVLDDDTSQTVFYTVSVTEPRRVRVFMHDGRLWLYHPLLNRLDGWDLRA